jgi:CHAD domain-containing protein
MDDPRPASIHSLSRRVVPPAQPVKARVARIHKKMSPDDAFRTTLADCLAQMTANAATLRNGRSVEGLHQLRVSFRRLDATLDAFGTEFGLEWLEELRGRAKVLSSRIALARDLDVFTCDLLDGPAAAAQGMERDSFNRLRTRAGSARDAAWTDAAECVAGADFAMFLDDVAGLAQSRLPVGRQQSLPKLARRLLRRQARRVTKRGRKAQSREEGDMHQLRIALKKLRYTAEFFASLYPKKKVGRYLKKVRQLQERLGELNDIVHVRSTVTKLLRGDEGKTRSQADLRFAAGAVSGWYSARSGRVAKRTLKRYRKFRGLKPFWD